MISTTKKAEHVITDGLGGERRAFTIKATGKAFRTLIDGLYENKIGAVVREIISNGYDSHAAAKLGDVPLNITAPTAMDPTFRVRDYGVSMTHEDIMDLYSTIFESTKENTNDQVGMFGLGSKSPFAYTDTFAVTAYLNGEKRIYVAHISDDDVPQITHIVTEPEINEPQGIEVAIPVKPTDVHKFHHEITRMILASDVEPILDGLVVPPKSIKLEQPGFRIIDDIYSLGLVAIRQGCVIYPVHSMNVSGVNYGYTTIIDVPIGSVEVTASRESLSLTPETRQFVEQRIEEVRQSITTWVASLKFENRLDSFLKSQDYAFLTIKVGRHEVSLKADKPNRLPQQTYLHMTSKRKFSYKQATQNPETLIVIVETPGVKVVRKNVRIANFWQAKSNHGCTQVAIVQRQNLPRFVRLFGLKPSQVISLDSLPDSPPAARVPGARGTRSALPKVIEPNQFWMIKEGGWSINYTFGDDTHGHFVKATTHLFNSQFHGYYDKTPAGLRQTLSLLNFNEDDIVFFTQGQADKLKLNGVQEFLPEFYNRIDKFVADNKIQERLDAEIMANYVRKAQGWELDRYVKNALGVTHMDALLHGLTLPLARKALDQLVVDIGAVELTQEERFITNMLHLKANPSQTNLTTQDITDTISEAVKPYKELATVTDLTDFLLQFYFDNK